MSKVYAISQDYEGIVDVMGIFASKELAEQALANYLAGYNRASDRKHFASILRVVELTFHN